MGNSEIFKRLKIGLSLVVGLLLGKLAASWSLAHYSELFSVGFLAGAIGTQGACRLFGFWRQKKNEINSIKSNPNGWFLPVL